MKKKVKGKSEIRNDATSGGGEKIPAKKNNSRKKSGAPLKKMGDEELKKQTKALEEKLEFEKLKKLVLEKLEKETRAWEEKARVWEKEARGLEKIELEKLLFELEKQKRVLEEKTRVLEKENRIDFRPNLWATSILPFAILTLTLFSFFVSFLDTGKIPEVAQSISSFLRENFLIILITFLATTLVAVGSVIGALIAGRFSKAAQRFWDNKIAVWLRSPQFREVLFLYVLPLVGIVIIFIFIFIFIPEQHLGWLLPVMGTISGTITVKLLLLPIDKKREIHDRKMLEVLEKILDELKELKSPKASKAPKVLKTPRKKSSPRKRGRSR